MVARGSNMDIAIHATAYTAKAATNERLAAPKPSSKRMRLAIDATRPIPTINPTTDPITRSDALVVTGSRHARQAAVTITLLRERPAHAIPVRPANVAIQRVLVGCVSAVLICSASVPVTPAASLTSSGPVHEARKPNRPTTANSSGTKNRNSRKARALPTIVPADSRSR